MWAVILELMLFASSPIHANNGMQPLIVIGIPDYIVQRYRTFGTLQELPTSNHMSLASYLLFRDLKHLLNFTEVHFNTRQGVELKSNYDLQIYHEIMSNETASRIQYLQTTYTSRIRFFFVRPSAQSLRNIFFTPFQSSLWIALFSLVLLIFCTLYIIRANAREFSFDSFLCLTAAICQRGWYTNPTLFNIRIVVASTWITSLVLYSSYSAEIISQLREGDINLKGLQDLMKYDFIVGTSDDYHVKRHLKAMVKSEPNLRTKLITNRNSVIETLKTTKMAYLSYPLDFYHDEAAVVGYSKRHLCEHLFSVVVDTVPYPRAMSVPRGSEWKEPVNQKILLIRERGLFRRYISYYNTESELSCVPRKVLYSVTSVDSFVAFCVLGGVILVTIIILLLEIISGKRLPKPISN